MEINFRNINLISTNIRNVISKLDSKHDEFNSRESTNYSSKNIQSYKNLINDIQFNSLTRVQQSVLVKELLNLPKDIKDLLALLTFNNSDNVAVQKMLNDINKLIMFSDIQQILNTNSKEMLNKLIKLIQPTPGNIQNIDQLKEIISTIQAVIPSANMTNNELLKNVILLYLPWLPLVQPQDLSVEYDRKSNEEEQEENASLLIYISTENIGRLKGIITSNANYSLNIQIECINYDESIKKYLEIINKRVNEEIKSNNLSAKSEMSISKSKELNKTERREISIHSGAGISPKMLMTAYILTRVVFELDESISLNKNREKMMQEKS